MAKKDNSSSVNLDSFLDVLTCLQGILMLVIIATGIDAAQTKVLIPTPIERISTKEPVYLECRGNLLYPMDVAEISRQARMTMMAISQQAEGDQTRLMQQLSGVRVTNAYYEVDLTYYLLGQLVIKPRSDTTADGYELDERSTFSTDNYIVRLLKDFNNKTHRIVLIVRDDSFQVFKVVQRLSFLTKVELGVEIYDVRELLRFTQQGALITGT
ncbi:MAG TPA: hypothetical protein PKE12_10650 [Kiritimatiellia bacterium]|nr:hypothetical protein [Kiritimatiellia bacterium]